jgi:tight adherence protein B
VAELRSGQPTLRALERVAEEWSDLSSVASAARMGADVPHAFRTLALLPGAAALTELAAAWQVSVRSGAGLAGVLERMSETMRDQDDIAREVAAAVAPARATAQLLGVLPVVGLGLGTALGGDPLQILLGTPVGTVLLVLGASLSLVGLLWVEHLVNVVAG